MSAIASPTERLEVLFEDGRIVEIVAAMDRDELCGATGARSVAALVAWKLGSTSANAHAITVIARRLEEFPRCAQGGGSGRGLGSALRRTGRRRGGQPTAHRRQARVPTRT